MPPTRKIWKNLPPKELCLLHFDCWKYQLHFILKSPHSVRGTSAEKIKWFQIYFYLDSSLSQFPVFSSNLTFLQFNSGRIIYFGSFSPGGMMEFVLVSIERCFQSTRSMGYESSVLSRYFVTNNRKYLGPWEIFPAFPYWTRWDFLLVSPQNSIVFRYFSLQNNLQEVFEFIPVQNGSIVFNKNRPNYKNIYLLSCSLGFVTKTSPCVDFLRPG